MLSSQITAFPIDQIVVDRADRQRKEITGIDELAQSLSTIGQLHPCIIERSGKLRSGERRYTAAKQLGWTHVEVKFVEDLSESELQLLELDENIRRSNLSWQEECDAVERYHKLRATESGWTIAKTAEALNMSAPNVTQKIQVAEEIKRGNTSVTEASTFSVARGLVTRANERRSAAVLDLIAPEAKVATAKAAPIYNADFQTWWPTYEGVPFNFIHCDFPYGVKADKHDQGAAESFGGYDDSFETYTSLLSTLKSFTQSRACAESAHLMFWFSMDFYQLTFDKLTEMGWRVNPFPLIWHKSDNTGILPDPTRGPRRIYETAFLASRGDRKVVRAVSNVFSAPVVKTIHMSEKNLVMLSKFFEMLVDSSTVGLDPTCGSGNAIKAMLMGGASMAMGLEINEEFAKLAKENFYV